MRSMLINDQICNPVYNLDFAKFLSTITGSGGGAIGPGAGGIGAPGMGAVASNTAGYYWWESCILSVI